MTSKQVGEHFYTILERWGFPTVVAIAAGIVLRQDVLLPLLESHRDTLRQICETQKEISTAVHEQTKLLYALELREQRATPPGARD